jgi:cytochrome c peroxidase
MKLHLCFAGIALLLVVASATAAETETEQLKQVQEVFQPLPRDMAIPDAPITPERVDLGRLLFFDPRLTVDADLGCSSCHQPARHGTDGLSKSIGVGQRPHPRNAPTVLNAGLNFIIHWRGDRDSLEDQVTKALASPITSGQPDEKAIIDRLKQIPSYAPLFQAAFPDDPHPMTGENIAKAIGAYERTLVTPSPFDRYLAGDVNALSPKARRGLDTFINTGCAACHNGVLVGGGMYQKFGVVEDYWKATGSQTIDNGRADVTKNPDDLYLFRVASLRNVAVTAPYFHDGSVATLPEAVRVMARVQLGVTLGDAETSGIVAFLKSLTGELPANFTTVPTLPAGSVTPPRESGKGRTVR